MVLADAQISFGCILPGSTGSSGLGENGKNKPPSLVDGGCTSPQARTVIPASQTVVHLLLLTRKKRVRSTQAGLESANPAVGLLPVGDTQIDGAIRTANSNNRDRVGSMD